MRAKLQYAWLWARYLFGAVGLPGQIGLIAVVLAIGAYVGWLHPMKLNLAVQQTELTRAARHRTPLAIPDDPATRLDRLKRALPALGTLPDDLASLNQAAGRAGVQIGEVQYQLQPVADAPWLRYRASLPVSGGYPAVRRYLKEVLDALPHAALDEIRMERGESGAPVADLRLALYYREAP